MLRIETGDVIQIRKSPNGKVLTATVVNVVVSISDDDTLRISVSLSVFGEVEEVGLFLLRQWIGMA